MTTAKVLLLLLSLAGSIYSDTSITDSRTPAEVNVGTPDGSYALGNLEVYNPYNGSLNIHVPLYKVGGRGEAGYDIYEVIQQNWKIGTHSTNTGPGGEASMVLWVQPNNGVTTGSKWLPIVPLYAPGVVISRFAADTTQGAQACTGGNSIGYSYYYGASLTRLTFVDGLGTEHEMVDTATNGEPLTWYTMPPWNDSTPNCTATFATAGTNRGTTFRAMDTSDIQFVSDTPVYDQVGYITKQPPLAPTFIAMTGWLYFPNGLKYRVVQGSVTSIEDRNGNVATPGLDPLGRPISITTTNGQMAGTDTITYDGASGTQRTIAISRVPLASALDAASGQALETYDQLFPSYNVGSSLQTATYDPIVTSSITLPDSSTYQFTYTSYGDVASIKLPTGGRITYQWNTSLGSSCASQPTFCVAAYSEPVTGNPGAVVFRRLLSRKEYTDGSTLSRQTSYGYAFGVTDQNGATVTTVTDEDGNGNVFSVVKHHYYGDSSTTADLYGPPTLWYTTPQNGKETLTEYSNGSATLRQVLQAWDQRPCGAPEVCWFGNQTNLTTAAFPHDPQLMSETTTEGSAVKQSTYGYDLYNNQSDKKETDWGSNSPGGVLRETKTTYNTGATYIAANLWALPIERQILNASSALAADTKYAYDATAPTPSYGAVTGYTPPTGPRGNQTSVSTCTNVASCTWLITNYGYDSAGNVSSITDANNNLYSLTYADSYSDGNNGRNTYAHVTSIKNPLNQTRSWQYDFGSGHVSMLTDINGVPSTYVYNDALDRVTTIAKAAGTNAESDVNATYNVGTTEVDVYRDQNKAGDRLLHTQTLYDGLGREETAITFESSSSTIQTTESYDALSRVSQTTNPSRPGDGLGFWTTYLYDSLNRPTSVTTPDGSMSMTCYSSSPTCVSPSPSPTGNWSVATDQAGNQRQMFTDGLGRLSEVIAGPGSSPHLNYITNYYYDALDDLTKVNQFGQVRVFAYDSLKRLLGATNPENYSANKFPSNACGSGVYALCYSYDSVGNLLTKIDNRGAQVTYTYDAINRATRKVYTVPSGVAATPAVTYCYDGVQSGTCPSVGTVSFPAGHLTAVTNGSSSSLFTGFDQLGRILTHTQITANNNYSFSYSYNLAGTLTSESYPSGRVVNTCYDGANRVSQVSIGQCGASNVPTYVSGVTYAPHGAPSTYTYGNNLVRTNSYNTRLQLSGFLDQLSGGTAYFNAALNWGTTNNNGNLQSSSYIHSGGTGLTSPLTLSQSYTYDAVNRLLQANDTGYSRGFSYDSYGNMYVSSFSGITPQGNTPTSYVFQSNNQLTTGTYDAAGNETLVNGNSISYDAEGRQTSVVGVGVSETYVYDADGKRVEKLATSGTPTTVFVYDALGRMAAEYSSGTDIPDCITCYLSADHLGTPRLITDQNGKPVSRHDYLPFGEEILANQAGRNAPQWGAGNDSINQKFTGKERDSESGLDYFGARYYGSALGRFTSPDWSEKVEPVPYAELENPQTLNLYAYGRNNPLSHADLEGHCTADGEDHGWLWCAAHSVGLVQTQKEQADSARQSLSQMHGFTIGGQSPQDFAKNATNQQAIQGLRAADNYIAGQALSPCGPGVSCGVIVPPAGAEAGAVDGAEAEVGAQSDFINITRKGSVANIQTNVSAADFGTNLEANGFTKTTASDGTPIYTKGNTQYTVYPKSNSTGGPTAQVKINGAVVEKIRLQ